MIAGCYSIDLYCRNHIANDANYVADPRHNADNRHMNAPAQYTGATLGECRSQAVADGWVFGRDGDVTCPRCSGKRRKATPR